MDNFFNNPAFAGMSAEKLQFLMSFAQKDKPKNMRDIMPFLMANMRQAKQQNLDFSKPEVQLICDLLCKDLPPEQQDRMRKVMALMSGSQPFQQ
ncbi:MAG: hypothetical protein NC180_11220 [Muribaculaceae bacterium]|nr:hypothetical protein [Roseburia sp.]MCM1430987.1 hypothetical protein [Muribaculaceae bacterium]MCM1493779.1 hypothetical protein [Muribaculaceae bacterium]